MIANQFCRVRQYLPSRQRTSCFGEYRAEVSLLRLEEFCNHYQLTKILNRRNPWR